MVSYSQHSWTLPPLAAVLYPDNLDGVATVVEQFPASRALKHQVHNAADVRLRLRHHIHVLQPSLDHHRPNLMQQVTLPPRANMQLDIRQVRLPG